MQKEIIDNTKLLKEGHTYFLAGIGGKVIIMMPDAKYFCEVNHKTLNIGKGVLKVKVMSEAGIRFFVTPFPYNPRNESSEITVGGEAIFSGKPIRKYPATAVDNTTLLKDGNSYGFFTNGVDTLIRIDGIDYHCEIDASGFDMDGDGGKAVKSMDEFFIVRYPITDSAPLKKIIVREKYIGENKCI